MSQDRAVAPSAAAMTAPSQLLARARGLHHSFGQTKALQGVDIDIAQGEILAVMGPSGSGKSTLLHVLAGILQPAAGTVEYGGRIISELDEEQRSQLRLREFGFVFQFGQLLPDLSALDNVTIPLLLAGTSRRKALLQAQEELERLGLKKQLAQLPGQLSGGEAQRVAVARALVMRPRVLFADEPTGALDSLSAERTMEALTCVVKEAGASMVVITHDPRTASYADREVFVRDGKISAGIGVLEAA